MKLDDALQRSLGLIQRASPCSPPPVPSAYTRRLWNPTEDVGERIQQVVLNERKIGAADVGSAHEVELVRLILLEHKHALIHERAGTGSKKTDRLEHDLMNGLKPPVFSHCIVLEVTDRIVRGLHTVSGRWRPSLGAAEERKEALVVEHPEDRCRTGAGPTRTRPIRRFESLLPHCPPECAVPRVMATHWSGPRFFGLTPKRKAWHEENPLCHLYPKECGRGS